MTEESKRARAADVRVRVASERDFDDLTDLWERSARSSHAFMADDDFTEAHPYVRDALLPSMDVWLAEDADGEAVAFIGARESHVELLYVDPDHQGRGIGSLLLGLVGDDGPTSVEIYADNLAGRAFYAARGFTETHRRRTDAFGRPFPMLHLTR